MRWLVLLVVACSLSAWAQDGGVETEVVAIGPPLVAPKPTAHQLKTGHVGFGFLGASQVLRALPSSLPTDTTTVPLLGVRWWLANSRLALELGAGVMTSGRGSSSFAGGPASLEVLGHVGLPVMVVSAEHVIVFLEPEARVGFSYFAPDSTGFGVVTASTFELNLRAGVEVFFGFIGLENLSFEISVRAGVNHAVRSSLESFSVGVSQTSFTRFSTSLIGDPLEVISSSVAMRYYF